MTPVLPNIQEPKKRPAEEEFSPQTPPVFNKLKDLANQVGQRALSTSSTTTQPPLANITSYSAPLSILSSESTHPSSPKKQKTMNSKPINLGFPQPALRSAMVVPPNTSPTPPALSSRPKPNFDFLPISNENSRPTPPTPKRVSTSEIQSPFKKLHDNLTTGYLEWNNSYYSVTKLADGSYSRVYTLGDDQPQIVTSHLNSEIVIKAFHGAKSSFNEQLLNCYLSNIRRNYEEVKNLGLPVAEIFNPQGQLIIQRKIPHPIDFNNADHINQVKNFFKLSKENTVMMDLLPANLRVDENGIVRLIDFVEDREDGFAVFYNSALSQWRAIIPDFLKE